VRIARRVWNLRSQRCFRVITAAFAAARGRFGLRLMEFSVLGDHLHLVVEADGNQALSRGMQGLSVRIAKAMNRLMGTRGTVLSDHYHAHLLETPTEVVSAIAYVLGNAEHHYGQKGADPFSSAACDRERVLCVALSWLLLAGWRLARRKPWRLPPQPGLAC
jgi:REP element-mobilizing transposase RayT